MRRNSSNIGTAWPTVSYVIIPDGIVNVAGTGHDLAIQSFESLLTHLLAELAFPYDNHPPTQRLKFGMLLGVAITVAQQNSTFDFGMACFVQSSCICQKHPLTNTTV